MKIEINAGAVITAAVIGVCAWFVYKQAKAESTKQKEFKETKTKALESRNLDEEIDKATIANERLTVESRCKAKEVLKEDLREVEKSTDIETFDNSLKEFDRDIERFTVSNSDEAGANVLYQYNLLQTKLERKRLNEERVTRDVEINKIVGALSKPLSTSASVSLNDDSIRLISRCVCKAIEKGVKTRV